MDTKSNIYHWSIIKVLRYHLILFIIILANFDSLVIFLLEAVDIKVQNVSTLGFLEKEPWMNIDLSSLR